MKIPGGALVRLLALVAHALLGALIAITAPAQSLTDTRAGRGIVRWWHRTVLRLLGVRLRVVGPVPQHCALIVANHISWLDIPAIGALAPGHFVAKAEIASWPLIGWLAAQAGTYYIKRGDRKASAEVETRMAETLKAGHTVFLFPEGTSTDGTAIAHFHARLFGAAALAHCPIQPVDVCYPGAGRLVHPAAPFVGEDTLVGHLWRVLRARGTFAVELRFLAAQAPDAASVRDLAERAHAAISASHSPDPDAR